MNSVDTMCRSKHLDVIFELVDLETSVKLKLRECSDQRVLVLLTSTLKRIQDELKRKRKTLKRRDAFSCYAPPKRLKTDVEPMDYANDSCQDTEDLLGLDQFFARLSSLKPNT